MTKESERRQQPDWKKWGPYLSERQWGTVREDYSATGDSACTATRKKKRTQSSMGSFR